MHPIERLRYVARAGSAPDRLLVAESMPALSAFAHDPRALLVALKGLIARQPESPGLLALAAHMTHGLNPIEAGWEFADLLAADQTESIAETVAITESGGTDVIDSIVSGQFAEADHVTLLCPAGTQVWIDHAKSDGRSVVAVTPLGTRLPTLLWTRYLTQNAPELAEYANEQTTGWPSEANGQLASETQGRAGEPELVRLDAFDEVISSDGLSPLTSWQPDCPDVAEVARF